MTEYSIDDALLSMSTFYNGCDFRLFFDGDKTYVEYGCYGCHINLVQGANRALMLWVDGGNGRRDVHEAKPETIIELKKRRPCKECGGFRFKMPPPENSDNISRIRACNHS